MSRQAPEGERERSADFEAAHGSEREPAVTEPKREREGREPGDEAPRYPDADAERAAADHPRREEPVRLAEPDRDMLVRGPADAARDAEPERGDGA